MKSKILVYLLIGSMLLAGCSGAKQATTAPVAATTIAKPPATTTSSNTVSQAYIGVNFPVDVDSTVAAQNHLGVNSGVLCVQIVPGGPADKAGLKADDVITVVDGTAVTKCTQLAQIIQLMAPGTQIKITYYRGTSQFTTTMTLVSKPPPTS